MAKEVAPGPLSWVGWGDVTLADVPSTLYSHSRPFG